MTHTNKQNAPPGTGDNRRGELPKLTKQVGPYIFAAPEMKGLLNGHGKPWTTYTIGQYNIEQVLHRHNSYHSKRGKIVSEATKAHRWNECKAVMRTLLKLEYKIVLPTSISRKHIIALTRTWEQEGYTASTVLQKVSILRTLLNWMGKEALIKQINKKELFLEPEQFKRVYATTEDKSWSGKKDILAIFASVAIEDRFVAIQLKLSHHFGLRVKEASRFKPYKDINEDESRLVITRGTKGGRPREIEIVTQEQRQLLQEAKSLCHDNNDSMIPRIKKQGAWLKHYYRVINRHGISRANGITSHGLRHGYAHRVYEQETGALPKAVTGKKPIVNTVKDRLARLIVSQHLGHNRESISSAYIGDAS